MCLLLKLMTMQKPNVFESLDYREFLRQMLDYLQREHGLSGRAFGKILGFGSPSYLKALFDEKRSLSVAMGQKIARRLGLGQSETKFFSALILFNNEKTDLKKKDQYFQALLKYKKFLSARKSVAAEYEFFSSWYVVALLEALGTPWRHSSSPRMAADLGISDQQLKDSLNVLQNLGLIRKGVTGWERVEAAIETPAETSSVNIRNTHREMIQRALKAVDEMDTSERVLGSVTIALSVENIERLKARLFEFRQEINAEFSSDQDPDKVMQINFQAFPLFSLKKS